MIHTVTIKNHAFDPPSLKVKIGDGVIWQNKDEVRHSARRDANPRFDTGLLNPGAESIVINFTAASPAAGFGYYCEPHPHMTGTVIVSG